MSATRKNYRFFTVRYVSKKKDTRRRRSCRRELQRARRTKKKQEERCTLQQGQRESPLERFPCNTLIYICSFFPFFSLSLHLFILSFTLKESNSFSTYQSLSLIMHIFLRKFSQLCTLSVEEQSRGNLFEFRDCLRKLLN